MKIVPQALGSGLGVVGVFGLLLFLRAGTFDYRQA
jgi:hypothetical protein